ncbi:MAG: DUF3473 domain-containing protein [Hahellaceae bacterium]|jgi:polysaccharide deacetylase family protein (PEP-CTERM system associated)|nr:DUF3473 domain-containing protein [Hahellaceae bacterium]
MSLAIKNAMTIDVEDYFHVAAFEKNIRREDWANMPLRVEQSTDTLLALLDEMNVKATFFTLGWVADRAPDLVKRIAANGHEVASHGYMHGKATEQTREEFRQDVDRSKKLLEDLTGKAIIGYRAPSFSVNDTNKWVFDELKDLGFLYSSSTYPVKHDLYGVPHWPRFKYAMDNGLIEIPMTTLHIGSRNVPMSGGGYFRLYPYVVSRMLYRKFHRAENQPGIFYMHPWEIDPDQPRQKGASLKSNFRHYLNLKRVRGRLKRLMTDFEWGRMDEVFEIV